MGNAIALSLLSMNGTRIFAPALAGVLAGVAFFGIGGAYLVAGFCSLAAFGFLLALPSDRVADQVESAEQTSRAAGSANVTPLPARRSMGNPFADVAEGVRYVWAAPELRRLVITSFFVIMFGFNYIAFFPAMIEGVFDLDETWVGYISSASAIGAVAVSLPLAGKADSPWAKTAMTVGGMMFGIGVVLFGLAPSFWSAFVVVMIIGAAATVYQSLSNTLALALSDDSHQGRVQSLMMLSFAGFGLAAGPLGLLAEAVGLRLAITVMGSVTFVATLLYVLFEGGPSTIRPDHSSGPVVDEDIARPSAA
jgi:MFS family permease